MDILVLAAQMLSVAILVVGAALSIWAICTGLSSERPRLPWKRPVVPRSPPHSPPSPVAPPAIELKKAA